MFPFLQPAQVVRLLVLVMVLVTTSSCWLPSHTALEQAPLKYSLFC